LRAISALVVTVTGLGDGDSIAAAADDDSPELEASLEVASAYVFRGYNVFQQESQREQKAVQEVLVAWNASSSGLYLALGSANQLTGDNLVSNVDAGLGAEYDLFAGYDFGRHQPMGVTTELAIAAYPVAESRVVGTHVPLVASLSAEPRWRHELYFYVGYLHGFRRGLYQEDQLYLNPHVQKKLDLGERFELDLEVGAGVKLFSLDVGTVRDNMFDVLGTATIYCALTEVIYVGARVGWAWTNFTAQRDPVTGATVGRRFADEYVPFWAISVGAELSPEPIKPRAPARRVRPM
jgi:hypothetical protein